MFIEFADYNCAPRIAESTASENPDRYHFALTFNYHLHSFLAFFVCVFVSWSVSPRLLAPYLTAFHPVLSHSFHSLLLFVSFSDASSGFFVSAPLSFLPLTSSWHLPPHSSVWVTGGGWFSWPLCSVDRLPASGPDIWLLHGTCSIHYASRRGGDKICKYREDWSQLEARMSTNVIAVHIIVVKRIYLINIIIIQDERQALHKYFGAVNQCICWGLHISLNLRKIFFKDLQL